MQKINPFLWFDNQAEEAVKFYTSIFKQSKIGRTVRCNEQVAKTTGQPAGSVLSIESEIAGEKVVALNGGPHFKFNRSVSLVVNCEGSRGSGLFFGKLAADGGEESACGWLKDQFGSSWQVVPTVLINMLHDPDSRKSERVMDAMLQMQKINVRALEDAYAEK